MTSLQSESGAASRVANEIRGWIVKGELQPGAKLAEERMRAQLAVSRSTLREGFQLLVRERLVVHVLSSGFFVRRLAREDIADLMATREVVECGALWTVNEVEASSLDRVETAVVAGQTARESEHWQAVAAASIEFHRGLVALAGSARLDYLIAQILAEFRLAYGYMEDPLAFHVTYLRKHETILKLLKENAAHAAAEYLRSYLTSSRIDLLVRVPE
ncbi:GntR family transcriptional regulator [Brevibacterium daeguense]|uniref:GntR family transcriptional regulator n=1 Tax=Brevibacterium daeguense TaxID=909936 RepID=A0ABP8EHD7_9MICO